MVAAKTLSGEIVPTIWAQLKFQQKQKYKKMKIVLFFILGFRDDDSHRNSAIYSSTIATFVIFNSQVDSHSFHTFFSSAGVATESGYKVISTKSFQYYVVI